VALAHDGEAPTFVLDAGTGLSRLSRLLGDRPFRGAIVLGHLHWDHTHGLPFFPAGDRPDARVDLFMPAQGDPEAVLARVLSPPHFPITPAELRGDWRFFALEAGEHDIEGFSVLALEIPHKGGRTFGYRVSDGTGTVAYLSDHSPLAAGPGPAGLGAYHPAACALARGADVLLHDAQHTAEELPARAAFGHSAAEYAVGLAETAGVGRLVLFHHDPSRTDNALDDIVTGLRNATMPVAAAAENMVLEVPASKRLRTQP
jgi:ribonuclease BN (tRNA processing enzyme)